MNTKARQFVIDNFYEIHSILYNNNASTMLIDFDDPRGIVIYLDSDSHTSIKFYNVENELAKLCHDKYFNERFYVYSLTLVGQKITPPESCYPFNDLIHEKEDTLEFANNEQQEITIIKTDAEAHQLVSQASLAEIKLADNADLALPKKFEAFENLNVSQNTVSVAPQNSTASLSTDNMPQHGFFYKTSTTSTPTTSMLFSDTARHVSAESAKLLAGSRNFSPLH